MTPTLFGRWQTRLLLLATVGVLVSLPFAIGLIGSSPNSVYFWILGYVAIFGLGWDVLYNYLQKSRWDRDWPAAYQLLAGIWELLFVFCGIKLFGFLAASSLGKLEYSSFASFPNNSFCGLKKTVPEASSKWYCCPLAT